MGNVFHGGTRSLSMSNGGTSVFVEVLMLAVTDLAGRPWDYRFATLLTLQDQSIMGRGAVGFDLEDIDWGRSRQQQAEAKDFVLRVIDLALRRHRWDELRYDPPFAQDYLHEFRDMVDAFDPAIAERHSGTFPSADEAASASCVRHRVLSSLPHWEGCVFCNT
ncbi:hypothetical protein [Streptomyces natalensis]|uniref:Uncharacterized protein n=1 Tax=Streptomyces natalensis ATCC 27448 TaxID=1240678 RepID=A0A0D7CK49_9ACTN|nr:hypothetical protein [Streptomyces natalensis]KIZ15797.1 hypothetical protein SNA_21020 [Streptomyces natalensis ATCC 27448]